MAQTRRMGKHNQKGVPTKSAEVFALPNHLPSVPELNRWNSSGTELE